MYSPFQEYNYADVRDRQYLLTLHKHAKKVNLDVDRYNQLRDSIAQTEYDLKRLRDPLQLQLPIQHLNSQYPISSSQEKDSGSKE